MDEIDIDGVEQVPEELLDWLRRTATKARHHHNEQIDSAIAARPGFLEMAAAASRNAYRLPGELVAAYLQTLIRKDTRPEEWRLGYELYTQFADHVKDSHLPKARGPNFASAHRVYLLAYMGWCDRIEELGQRESAEQAADLFGVSYDDLMRWLEDRNGKYASNHRAARSLLEASIGLD